MSEMEVMVSIMCDYIIELFCEGKRIDGCFFEDYCDFEIKVNVIEKVEGFVWVRLGDI